MKVKKPILGMAVAATLAVGVMSSDKETNVQNDCALNSNMLEAEIGMGFSFWARNVPDSDRARSLAAMGDIYSGTSVALGIFTLAAPNPVTGVLSVGSAL